MKPVNPSPELTELLKTVPKLRQTDWEWIMRNKAVHGDLRKELINLCRQSRARRAKHETSN